MKKLSLAVFNTQPPHLYFGGVERRIIETTKRLRNDIDTTVYSGTKAGFKKPSTINGVKFAPCFSTDTLYPVDNWTFNRSLANAADTIKADVYEAHTVSGYAFQKTLKKRGIHTPFIQTIHGVLADEYQQSTQTSASTLRAKLANLIMWQLAKTEQETAKNANLIVTVSKYSAKKITQLYNIDKTKIRVIPNGVDTQKFKPTENCQKIKHQLGLNSKLCILFVGRLIPRKGLPHLIEAAKQITKKHPHTQFIIAGNGPLKNTLTTHIEKLNLTKNFTLLGDIKDTQLPTLYNCADIFVLPSTQEGQGIALLEAQATAKPVVAFNTSGIRETVIDKQTGLLTKPDSHELAEAIMKLLADYSLRKKMGNKGREFVSNNYSWDICAQKMLQVYHEAAGT